MRILFLANHDVGLYRFRKELISELLNNNEVFLSLPKGEFVECLTKMGCHFIETNIARHGTNPLKELKLLRFYKRIIKKIRPEIVLTYTIKPNVYGGIACSRLKVPYISNVTGLGNSIENKGFLQRITLSLYKKGLRNAYCVFFQNEQNMNFMIAKKIIKGNFVLLPGSGVNLEENSYEEYPDQSDSIVFVTIGRIMKEKGIDELLAAAAIIKSEYNNITFKVIGAFDGAHESIINNAVQKHLIEYLGHRNDVHDIIKKSHATIHPSYHEGTSNVLLETAACGRPILASNVPGCNNTFDEQSGISFEPKDVDSLVSAIKTFILLPYEKKRQMGIMGRKKMEKEFDRRIVINEYISQINKVKKEKYNETL